MSIIGKYGNQVPTEGFGESNELKVFNSLPQIDEAFLVKYLTENCDESITDHSQFPDPFLFKGMKEAVNIFLWAVRNQKRILCVSDSDCDGVGSRKGA